MRLLLKTFGLIFIGILGLLTINAALMVRRETRLFDGDMRNDELLLGRAMEQLVRDTWSSRGEARALELLEAANADQGQVRIRWVWLDAGAADPHAPALPPARLDALRRGEALSIKLDEGPAGGRRLSYVPVALDIPRQGAIELSEPLTSLHSYTRETILRVTWLALLMAAIVFLLMWIVGVHFVGRPLAALMRMTERIGSGDFRGESAVRGNDELARLGRAMNRMSLQLATARDALLRETEARIEAIEHLRHTERLARIGHLASGIAHELGTPLNVIGGRAKLIAGGSLEPAEVSDFAQTIGKQVEHMTAIIRQLLDFARRQPSQRAPTRLDALAQQVLDLLGATARKTGVTLSLRRLAELPPLPVDGWQIQQVLINLVMNGLQAMPDGGRLSLSLDRRQAGQPERDCAVLVVEDEGRGIAAADLPLVFDPFFTTKDVGQGTGLGLSISHGIIADHGGWIKAESELGRGSRFTVFLPCAEGTCAVAS